MPTVLGQLAKTGNSPQDLLFPEAQSYAKVRAAWNSVCRAAGITGATPHDARHTYGVHAAHSGVPIARLQKLMGHSSPIMTMRYMQHSPQAFMETDAEAIAQSMAAARTRAALRIA